MTGRTSTLFQPKTWLHGVKRLLSSFHGQRRIHGGIGPLITHTLQLFRHEGPNRALQKIFRVMWLGGQYQQVYLHWLNNYGGLSEDGRALMLSGLGKMPSQPLISVLMPVYNPNPAWLRQAIDSVCNQLYPHWELCIADDASSNPDVAEILRQYVDRDSRIKLIQRDANGHISAASNSALSIATGDWAALLDHDDLLAEDALFWVVDVINRHPRTQLIYSDEDKIDSEDVRREPYFKCDWNYDLFLSQNLISHLGVYNMDLLRRTGGFRTGFEGSQDYDLALRCIEQIESDQIHHIPRVLYHWRLHADSTAHSNQAKPYARQAATRALEAHLQRQGVTGTVESHHAGYRIRYAAPARTTAVSVIIYLQEQTANLGRCLQALVKTTEQADYEILIACGETSLPMAQEHAGRFSGSRPVTFVTLPGVPGVAPLINAAVEQARGEYLIFLSADLAARSDNWLTEMLSHAARPGVGAVGAKRISADDNSELAGLLLCQDSITVSAQPARRPGDPGYFGRAQLIQNFSVLSLECMAIRKVVFERLDGLNTVELAAACYDADFCLRIGEAGYRNVWTPYAEFQYFDKQPPHYGSASAPDTAQAGCYMRQRWRDALIHDPAYSPNLSLNNGYFELAPSPRLAWSPCVTPQTREEKALHQINPWGQGLEIGAGHSPLAPKRRGFKVHILDHADKETLTAKYSDVLDDANLGNIEEVDFVWQGEALPTLIGKTACYDWILASHVIEHTPDLIGFLNDCEMLLKADGVLSLVIPDKRYCFDCYSPITTTGEVLDAHEQGRIRPTPGKVFDHYANESRLDGQIAWSAGQKGLPAVANSFTITRQRWLKARTDSDYHDIHNWRFTPASFLLILRDLQELELTRLDVLQTFDTAGCEFFVTLGKNPSLRPASRPELLARVVAETGGPGAHGSGYNLN